MLWRSDCHTYGGDGKTTFGLPGLGGRARRLGGVGLQNYVNDPGPPPVSAPISSNAIGYTGGGEPHENMPPYLALNYLIAL